MPAYFVTSLSFSPTRPELLPGSPTPGSSPNCSHISVIGIIGDHSSALRQLLTTIIAMIIFVVLPIGDSKAEIPLPGMQFPMVRTATFDRKESVLDRFRAFSGKKTQAAREGLFTHWDPVFSQNPAVLLSDGRAVARITLRLQGRTGVPPNFSITGGHCVSAKMTDTGVWILEILPNRGSLSTSLTVAFSGQMTEYPLTVAPPMDLFEPRNADTTVIDYVTTANHLATSGMNTERK
ncbi:MAG: hypothetical protein PHD01_08970 [Geobacteraceae bacterium]|nr:hypothetical protein [Geobacteraceae bacterium]